MASPDELINDARNYAVNVSASASSALNAAMQTVQAIGGGSVPAGPATTPTVDLTLPTPGDPGVPPSYTGNKYIQTDFKGKTPTLDGGGSLSLPSAPGAVPAIAAYTPPTQPGGAADTSLLAGPPTVNPAITFPTAPDLLSEIRGITKPVILPLSAIPTMPTYQPPEFKGVSPAAPPTAPTNLDTQMATQYATIFPVMANNTSAQIDVFIDHQFPQFRTALASVESRLATYMAGGTALTPAIENAIYNRTLSKTDRDAQRAKSESWGKAARAGFTLPSVMLLSQQDNIDLERRNNNAQAASDIAIKQAELEQHNLQFAVTQSINLRQMMLSTAMTYFNALVHINGQALEYARAVIDAIVKAYDLAVHYSEIQARIYEAEANIYRAKVDGAMATIHAYEAQIKGILAQAEVNTAMVGLYTAQVRAVESEANVYRAQIEAILGQVQLEKLKVEIYQARVGAYSAQVNGYTAQWQGYSAAVSGAAATVQASTEQIRAYGAQVNAFEALVRAKTEELNSRLKVNQQKLEAYKVEVDAYAALEHAKVASVGAEITSYDSTVKAFMAKAEAISQKSRSEIAVYEVGQRGLLAAAQLQFEYLRETDGMNVARATGVARIAEAIGGIYAGIAQATLAGMNSLAAATTTSTS